MRGPIRNLAFRNVKSRGLEKPIFKARPENPIEGVWFEDCRFEVVGDDVLPPIDASNSKLIRTCLALYKAEGRREIPSTSPRRARWATRS